MYMAVAKVGRYFANTQISALDTYLTAALIK